MSSFRLTAALLVAALINTAFAQQPQMSVKKEALQVAATIAETPSQAATRPSRFDCTPPFTFTLQRVYGAGKPMVYDISFEFVGVETARELGPGKCFRQRGWVFGAQALSRDRKGVLIYRVDMGTCPFLESLTVREGKITNYKSRETFVGSMWLDQAVRGGGVAFTVDATFIGTQAPNAAVPYAVTVPPDVSPRAATCTP